MLFFFPKYSARKLNTTSAYLKHVAKLKINKLNRGDDDPVLLTLAELFGQLMLK